MRANIGVEEVSEAAFADSEIVRLAAGARVLEDDEFNGHFPDRRFARVTLALTDGSSVCSRATEARGDPHVPLSDSQLSEKYNNLVRPVLGVEGALELQYLIESVGTGTGTGDYIDLMTAPR